MTIHAFAAPSAGKPLESFSYPRPSLGPHDVEIAITHCGLCHSDIHMIDNDWGMSSYPLVPGHEVVGTVRALGSDVVHVAIGQRVGVGWQCGSCMDCRWCVDGQENCCAQMEGICAGRHGGFADVVCVDSRFVYEIPDTLASEDASPLLCAGITVFAPLYRLGVCPTSRVGVIGVGGLGHLAIQFAHAFGCHVTAFSTTPAKQSQAEAFGADQFVVSTDASAMQKAAGSLDFLLSTVHVALDGETWLGLLGPNGTLCIVGAASGQVQVAPMSLIVGQKSVRGSVIGGRSIMRQMLDFAARHKIRAQVEVVPMTQVNTALDKVKRNKARYRMVLANG